MKHGQICQERLLCIPSTYREADDERHLYHRLARFLDASHRKLYSRPHEEEQQDEETPYGIQRVRRVGGDVYLLVRVHLRIGAIPLTSCRAGVVPAEEEYADGREDGCPDHDGKDARDAHHERIGEPHDL